VTLDSRLTLGRPDLAAANLESLLRAGRFEAPKAHRVAVPSAPLRAGPETAAEQVSQVIFGERFDVLDRLGDAVWGQCSRDGYVGWAPASALSPDLIEPTHRVIALRTFAFAEPSIKSPPFGPISLNALVRVTETRGGLDHAQGAGWIAASHLAPIGAAFVEPADTAERFLGAPYLWGGRDSLGLDCSGLIQQAFWAGGLACPRDSDQQAGLGLEISADVLQRGELVFWRGHVGLMLDAARLIHANGFHMAVTIEPLAEAKARIIAQDGGAPTAFRRPPRAAI
jgi:hypothetical protein